MQCISRRYFSSNVNQCKVTFMFHILAKILIRKNPLTCRLERRESTFVLAAGSGMRAEVCNSCIMARKDRTSSWYCCHWSWDCRNSSPRLTAWFSKMATRWLRLVSDSWISPWLWTFALETRSWAWLLKVMISLCSERSSLCKDCDVKIINQF